ncbi:hypothetical protein XM47_10775 [Catenovulum maritimum]|uniref:START domain-containing protein n=1 Tax=Catenovulum maritimum TaxID=1513271 RepID=A0A0J8GQV9_9ALTE|nr:hypothetical protein XM47_10775 [Catenovulum maritimum]
MNVICLILFSFSLSAQQTFWAMPTFDVGEAKEGVISVEQVFHYELFQPKQGYEKVRLVQRKYASLSSAEEAFVARMSAIASLDYQWWLDTWEVDSKQLALNYYANKGLDQTYWLDTWQKQFVGRKITYKQKIVLPEHTIIIYNVAAPNGKPGPIDLPVVFEQAKQEWLVSLDLRRAPLLRYSPWIKGLDKKEIVYE